MARSPRPLVVRGKSSVDRRHLSAKVPYYGAVRGNARSNPTFVALVSALLSCQACSSDVLSSSWVCFISFDRRRGSILSLLTSLPIQAIYHGRLSMLGPSPTLAPPHHGHNTQQTNQSGETFGFATSTLFHGRWSNKTEIDLHRISFTAEPPAAVASGQHLMLPPPPLAAPRPGPTGRVIRTCPRRSPR
jgi:hypothetical protein